MEDSFVLRVCLAGEGKPAWVRVICMEEKTTNSSCTIASGNVKGITSWAIGSLTHEVRSVLEI